MIHAHYLSPGVERFRDSRIRHYTDNQAVTRIFSIGSPNLELQLMAEQVFDSCKKWNITLEFIWQSRETVLMVKMDQGSRGPWGYHDEFTLDFDTAENVISRGITIDGFASFRNRLCQKYFSRGFEIESAGTDFFQQSIDRNEKVLIHPHPRMLVPALRHAAKFGLQTVVVFHIWRTLASTFVILKGGHMPKLAKNTYVCHPDFKGSQESPAFWGRREFATVICEMNFAPNIPLEKQLQKKVSKCLFNGCSFCSKFS